MSTMAVLLAEIDAYLEEAGIAETTFGRLAVNDGKFVGRLRNGAGITVAMVDRVRAYIANQRARASADPHRRTQRSKPKAAA